MSSEFPERYFKYDAFISYAHLDNQNGVVTALHAQLEEFLCHHLEWKPSVWLDQRSLNTNRDLAEEIRTALRESAVLIIVTSETTESREWCRNEMGWFLQEARLDLISIKRAYLVFLPFDDIESLPRWVEHMVGMTPFAFLDPTRKEVADQQDGNYGDKLYQWFLSVAEGIVNAHAAYREYEKMLRKR